MNELSSPLWSYSFRPFFLGAAVVAAVSIVMWILLFTGHVQLPLAGLPPVFWHAHEMLFGYAAAIIAGFLLTAVRNWTQQPGVDGMALLLLAICWAVPRLLFFLPFPGAKGLIVFFDLLFISACTVALIRPIVVSGQLARQAGIVSKLVLLCLTHAAFFVAFWNNDLQGLQTSLYAALYLIVALCLALARRLVPFFVKSTTGIELPNAHWIDRASLWGFLAFWIAIIATGHSPLSAALAAALFCIHASRLWGWRTTVIFNSPLLWVLYAAYSFFLVGFLLLLLGPFLPIPLSAAIHAFAVGGIGTLTIGMMSRVSWGHTGRNVSQPPRYLGGIFLLVITAALARIAAEFVLPGAYLPVMQFAAASWSVAFVLFLLVYSKVLLGPRYQG